MKKQSAPLIIERHPTDYTGFPFVTLIQYHKNPMLCIIDNADDHSIRAFVLDMCSPAGVDEEVIVVAAQSWYDQELYTKYPISIHFSRLGISSETAKIYRSINIEFVSRAIGPVPKYPMVSSKNIKRRKRKSISPAVEIHNTNTNTNTNIFK